MTDAMYMTSIWSLVFTYNNNNNAHIRSYTVEYCGIIIILYLEGSDKRGVGHIRQQVENILKTIAVEDNLFSGTLFGLFCKFVFY